MASISTDKGGNRRVLWVDADGQRRQVRLGKIPLRAAEAIQTRIEHIVAARRAGIAWDGPTAEWVAGLPDDLAGKLAAVGLIPARERVTLGPFIADYIAKRQDVKPASKTVWKQGERSLIDYFGPGRSVQEITPAMAEDFKQALIGQKLALYTVRKRLQAAKMFFGAMVRRGAIRENPFTGVQVAAVVNQARNVFGPRADVAAILEACPDAEWRAMVCLSRFAGLRLPSEVLSLKWEHIDWEKQRITVPSPKTAHHPGGSQRGIPFFP